MSGWWLEWGEEERRWPNLPVDPGLPWFMPITKTYLFIASFTLKCTVTSVGSTKGGMWLLNAFVRSLGHNFRRRQWHPTPVLLPGESHGRRSLVGCSPWGRLGSDTTERLQFHFSLSCTGEGNGNPLQCSCLENPRDGEPGGLPSMGSHRVRHDWSDLAAAAAAAATAGAWL